ncbi:hypothetical protein RHSIM_Rhsim05G0121300 [Rhododendron simsii]|uniref:C3H1-type domain-containing protein n=1 Tax=Rhododendron simsii TaxID=118357 RepID=A0A834LK00_RHOSS|nr:hypothetical protein RHSIM_Rhsim05G0121300 [Rhododendron simsii]
MPLLKYYCDYCEKQFQDTPAARKRHLQGVQHQRAKAIYYQNSSSSFLPDANHQMHPESFGKGVCNRFLRTARPSAKAEGFSQHIRDIHDDVRRKIAISNEIYKQHADLRRRFAEFDEVLKKISCNAYVLELPDDMGISNVFYIEDLTRYSGHVEDSNWADPVASLWHPNVSRMKSKMWSIIKLFRLDMEGSCQYGDSCKYYHPKQNFQSLNPQVIPDNIHSPSIAESQLVGGGPFPGMQYFFCWLVLGFGHVVVRLGIVWEFRWVTYLHHLSHRQRVGILLFHLLIGDIDWYEIRVAVEKGAHMFFVPTSK